MIVYFKKCDLKISGSRFQWQTRCLGWHSTVLILHLQEQFFDDLVLKNILSKLHSRIKVESSLMIFALASLKMTLWHPGIVVWSSMWVIYSQNLISIELGDQLNLLWPCWVSVGPTQSLAKTGAFLVGERLMVFAPAWQMSEWVNRFYSRFDILQSHSNWNKVHQGLWLNLATTSCM